MSNKSSQNKVEKQLLPVWLIVVYAVVITLAIDGALLMSVAGKLSWFYSGLSIFSAVILATGMLVSAREVFKSHRSRLS